MTALGSGVAGGRQAVTGRDVGGILAKTEDAAVAEVDEGIGDAEFGKERAQALEGVAFEDAGEVEDDGRIVEEEVRVMSSLRFSPL